ncbi:amino acid transporter [Coprinopsis cinerea okayama7|uniref:Amino acid transporter n=1 Tax=Coprinopsis cinerea (strain Okayama-7 / 130 / ATCC MYA-4618 / FGSC 9003) TaxID=240176 RepID=A8N1Y0_COPC7|nr:amino acid transporter [Coprinopsis cinerea okayama7\|eukprot:XP_001828879.2 amino acid transporter [Coprinopsis cinerea okayama7\
MASFGTSFSFGSAVSATGSAFSDAFESYRRAQYLVAGSAVAPTSEASDLEDEDEETGFSSRRHTAVEESDDEYDPDDYRQRMQMRPRDDSFVGQLDWDEDQHDAVFPASPLRRPSRPRYDTQQTVQLHQSITPRVEEIRKAHESTPLLSQKSSSIQEQLSIHEPVKDHGILVQTQDPSHLAPPSSLRRRSSAASHGSRSIHYSFGGRSTYGQTLFNSIAILLGIGMLSEPLAFAYAGWAAGTILIILYALISCYTAKILARIILSDPRLRSYSDIGRKAFGPRATGIISFMFCLELFAVTVVLVTLYADSLHTLIPAYSEDMYKLLGLIVLIPTVFMPLSLLSYTSILGIISTVMLVFVIFIDGFTKTDAPGSLWDPAPTRIGIQSYNKLGLAFGLFMAGFSGHPVIPSLARDMADPSQFDNMINWAFIIATFIYIAIGAAGYLMFGDSVHDEVEIWFEYPAFNYDHRPIVGP